MTTYGVDRSATSGGTGTSTTALQRDGTTPLSGNWDAGSFEIRAQTLRSDVATGTAPFVSASTTVCTNLNADLLDGYHAADITVTNDHGELTGLTDDDHVQYIRVDGTRAFTGNVTVDKTTPKVKLVRTADSSEDSSIEFCDSSGAVAFDIRTNAGSFYVGRYSGASEVSRPISAPASGTLSLQSYGGAINIGGGATASELRMYEPSASGTNYWAWKAQAMAQNITYMWPSTPGVANQVLTAKTPSELEWKTAGIAFSGNDARYLGDKTNEVISGIEDFNELLIMMHGIVAPYAAWGIRLGDSGNTSGYTSGYSTVVSNIDSTPSSEAVTGYAFYTPGAVGGGVSASGNIYVAKVDSSAHIYSYAGQLVDPYNGAVWACAGGIDMGGLMDRIVIVGTFSTGYVRLMWK
jgi:hypothetical protein